MSDNLIPINTMGYYDEEKEQWVPIDAAGIRSNKVRFTADDIEEKFLSTNDLINKLNTYKNDEFLKRSRKFEDYLNYQKIIFSVPARDSTKPFPQGISINQKDDELYIIRQENSGNKGIITRYKLSTTQLIDSKEFSITSNTYNEGIPWFKNDYGDLCFLVRQVFEDQLSIFNYTNGKIERVMDVLGSYKIGNDLENKYFISGNSDNENLNKIYLYDFQSIVNGTPNLLQEVQINNKEIMFEKVQGLTFHDNKIVLGQGKDYPSITVLNLDGSIEKSYSFSKESFADLIELDFKFNRDGYKFENEGVCMVNWNGYAVPALMQIAVEQNGKETIYVTLSGVQDGYLLETEPRPRPNIADIVFDKAALHFPNRNFITNGAFDVWQRGTSFSDDGVFTADRWLVNAVGTNENGINRTERVTKPMSAPFSNKYGLRITKLTNNSSMERTDLIQRIENPSQFKGENEYTLALWARTNKANHRIRMHIDLQHNGSHDNLAARVCNLTPEFSFFVLNFNFPDVTNYLFLEEDYLEVHIDIDTLNSTSRDSLSPNDWVEIYLVKLEKGHFGTPFVAKSLAEEYLECQRYYQVYSTGDKKDIDLRPLMRTTPIISQRPDGSYEYVAELPEIPTK
ncbi:hypothetical protein [Bacillus subtilis]|uniref:hypothetical protein n=1 Tax=Bacillus subtilis TaxID=1423 RepID=UPI001B93FE0B|nr:hypothetical protein [Bacillus subtilis]CAF1811224.1 hypothetical protein NRS6148_00934 [Bacillus subtilis]